MTSIFITAAGTDAGKTEICVALLEQMRRHGVSGAAYKPIATGFDVDAADGSDAGRLLAAQHKPLSPTNLDTISPWRFAAPLSPDIAARREGRRIDFDALVRFCRDAAVDGLTLIEGIGGVMVPLDEKHTVLDWILALDVPVLLIVGSYLGAISHALTAAKVLSSAGVEIAAIVVNQSEIEPMPTADTAATLARFVPGVPVEIVARAAPGASVEAARIWHMLEPRLPVAHKKSPAGRRDDRRG